MSSSPHSRKEMLVLAAAHARAILKWHGQIGLSRMFQKMHDRPAEQERYLSAIQHFSQLDMTREDVQAELARTQLNGVFEWFYSEEIPQVYWQTDPEIIHSEPPRVLNQAAKRILELHRLFPERAPERESTERGEAVTFNTPEELLIQARAYYARYTTEENLGIGGANFLLSCSLERNRNASSTGSGDLTLLTPEYLGFETRPATKDDLLGLLRSGSIRIAKVEGN